MVLRLNPASGIPLYVQLIEQVKHAIETGAIRAGEQLPSVRQMAEDLLINPNTVVRAYRELEHEEIIELRQRVHSRVDGGAGAAHAKGSDGVAGGDGPSRSIRSQRR